MLNWRLANLCPWIDKSVHWQRTLIIAVDVSLYQCIFRWNDLHAGGPSPSTLLSPTPSCGMWVACGSSGVRGFVVLVCLWDEGQVIRVSFDVDRNHKVEPVNGASSRSAPCEQSMKFCTGKFGA